VHTRNYMSLPIRRKMVACLRGLPTILFVLMPLPFKFFAWVLPSSDLAVGSACTHTYTHTHTHSLHKQDLEECMLDHHTSALTSVLLADLHFAKHLLHSAHTTDLMAHRSNAEAIRLCLHARADGWPGRAVCAVHRKPCAPLCAHRGPCGTSW